MCYRRLPSTVLEKGKKSEEREENDKRTNYVNINVIFLILLSKLASTQINPLINICNLFDYLYDIF